MNIEILQEFDNFIVVNKPAGVNSHETVAKEKNSVLELLQKQLSLNNLYLPHRLDKGTSGCMLVAKTVDVCTKLSEELSSNKISKKYIAIVEGLFPKDLSKMEDFLKVVNENKKSVAKVVKSGGKKAITIIENVTWKENYSIIEMQIVTGRMHQIRIQCAERGHSILGDTIYGKKNAVRLMLHCHSLQFENDTVIAEKPSEFLKYF